MARDPNETREIERQRRELRRQQQDMALGAVAPGVRVPQVGDPDTPAAPRSLARTIGDQLQGAVDTFAGPVAYGMSGFNGANPSSSDLSGTPVVAPAARAATPAVNLIEPKLASAGDVRTAAASGRSSGLTRIVKTADGTYVQTNAPNVKGQERIYDALGNRADVDTAQVWGPGRQYQDVQAVARAEQNAATRMQSDGGREAILKQGRRSLERVGEMRNASATAAQKQFLDSLDPKSRAQLLSDQTKEAGLDRRAAASNQITREGQRAALAQAANATNKTAFDQDLVERDRLLENPTGTLQELFGSMSNLSPADQVAALSNPNDPRSARARAAFQTYAQQQGLGDNFTPAQATRASGLRRFAHSPLTLGLTAPQYDSNNGTLFDTQFDASDLGLTNEQLDALIRADAQVRSRNR